MTEHSIPDIVGTIKKARITPTPTWRVVAKRVAFWALLVFFGVTGATFLSLGLIDILDMGPESFRALGLRRFPIFLFLSTPLLWTLLAALSILFGIFAFRGTTYGYRYRVLFVGSFVTLAILTLASLTHFTRFDEHIDQTVEERMPKSARNFLPPRALRFSKPEQGILAGRIKDASERQSTFTLETPQREIWTIVTTDATATGRMVQFEAGYDIIVFGAIQKPLVFEASLIRPLRNNIKKKMDANSPHLLPYNTLRGAHDL
jgi:hypothetical protein